MSKKNDFIKELDGVAQVTLASPATVGGVKVDSITMREPSVGDMKIVQNSRASDAEKEIAAIANLCELTTAEVEAMSLRNFGRLQAAFKLFTI
jgi:hypothetical protein